MGNGEPGVLRRLACRALAMLGLATLLGCGGRDDSAVGEFARRLTGNPVGGIETIEVDGTRYWFGFSYSADRNLSPLFTDAKSMAAFAATHMAQRDGAHDEAFWLTQAQEAVDDSSLSDDEGRVLALAGLREAIGQLRGDAEHARAIPGLVVPPHLYYLLLANAEWGEAEPSAAVKASAVRIGLEADDVSPWLDEPAAMLGGQTPLPVGATFSDAAAVYLWYWDTLRAGQQHGWRERLALP
jgi:hypothetical protein